MRDLIAKIFRPNSATHSGTAWVASEKYALTAFHCVEDPSGLAYPYGTQFRLLFESGLEVTAALAVYDDNVDVALLDILSHSFSTKDKIIFGKLPHGDGWARYRSSQNPTWECYGYPVGHEPGLSVDGTINEAEANVAGRISGMEVAIQLTCEHGGHGHLSGLSGAPVTHNGNVIGIIRSAPADFEIRIIHAVSMERIARALEPMRAVIKRNYLHAISIVAPNILGASEKTIAVSSDEDRRSCKTPTNLPRKLAKAHGRSEDSLKIQAEILNNQAGYFSLTGPDGVGKKNLALNVANNILGQVDGVYLADLFPIKEERALVEIANIFGVKEAHEQILEENLIAEIGARKTVIIVFSAERLAKLESTMGRLVTECANLRIVAVARQGFGWAIEHAREVKPLPLPPLDPSVSLDALASEPTVQLFLECLRLNDPNVELDLLGTRLAARLCQLAGGSRLGISLAATLSYGLLTIEKIGEFEEVRKSMEAYKDADIKDRHRALIALAFAKLDPELQTFLCRLAVFHGGCATEAAIEMDKTSLPVQYPTKKKLELLIKSNLVFSQTRHAKNTRYGMPVEVRAYCLDHMNDTGGLYSAHRDHADYFWRTVNQVERRITLVGGDDMPQVLAMLEDEYCNIIAAFTWLRNASGCEDKEEMGLSILGNLFWFWNLRGSLHEGRTLVEEMVQKPATGTESFGAALYCAGGLSFLQGDFAHARSLLTRSIAVLEQTGNDRRLAYALVVLGMVALHHGEPNEALWHEQRAVHLFEHTDNSIGLALASNDLANVLLEMQRMDEAEKAYLHSFKLWKDLNNAWGMGLTSSNLGHLHCRNEDFDTAERWLREAMAMQQAGRYQWGYAESTKRMGYVALGLENYPTAAGLFFDSLVLHQKIGRVQLVADSVDGLAEVAIKIGSTPDAGILLGAAEAIRERIGEKLNLVPQRMHDAAKKIAADKSTLDNKSSAVFDVYLDEGKKYTTAQASAYAAAFARHLMATAP